MNGTNETLNTFYAFGQVFYHTWWIVLPWAFYFIFKIIFKDYVAVRSADSWHKNLKWTYLEVIPPKDIERGPKVMESICAGISGVTTTHNTFDLWLRGAYSQDRFSFELIGEEGVAHFIIRCQKKYRNLIEAQVYAQYPGAEVIEVEDYTLRFPKVIPNKYWDMWGVDFGFTAPEAVPIKTYDRFEEDITGTMIDPMASILEVLGTLTPDQHIWLQYIIIPLQETWSYEVAQKKAVEKLKGVAVESGGGFLSDLGDIFRNIFSGIFGPPQFSATAKKDEQPLEFRLTPMEKERLKATEENLGKTSYTTKMRFLYIGKRDNFSKSYVSAFIGAIKQFNDMNYNQVKPFDLSKTYGKIFFTKAIADFRKRKIYKRYRDRDPEGVKLVLSSKELATLYHFPDMGVKAPSVLRVASKLGTAPPNLPIR
ncbi:MAG TPA: hypothetical protein PLK35_00890 [Candidatus Moranbacteria bacterium]|nr:hypothetical protein [Candidatus Moranbacteria bacterium]